MKNTTQVMTEGKPFYLLISFAVPVFLGNLFQQIYTVTDTAIVSRILGEKALAAVGSIGSVNFLILGFVFGMSAGFAVPVAMLFGSGDFEQMKKYAGNVLWAGGAVALIMTILSVSLCRFILIKTSTPSDIIDMAYSYMVVIFWGIPLRMAYNCLAKMIQALGNSKMPFYILLFSSLLNIVLDLLFIGPFHLGTGGAALATILSEGISALACIGVIRRLIPELCFGREDLKPRKQYILDLLGYGFPMSAQFSIAGIGSILLQTSVNVLGSQAVAAVAAGERIANVFSTVLVSIGNALTVYCGQNLGAKKIRRIRDGLGIGVVTALFCSVVLFGIVRLFGYRFILIFINSESRELIHMTERYLLTIAVFFWAQSIIFTVRFSLQGLGKTSLSFIACVLEMAARGLFGVIVVPAVGFTAVCYSSPAAWIAATLFLIPACIICVRNLGKSVIEKLPEDNSFNQ